MSLRRGGERCGSESSQEVFGVELGDSGGQYQAAAFDSGQFLPFQGPSLDPHFACVLFCRPDLALFFLGEE